MRLTCRGARPMPLLLVPLLFLVVLSGCIARTAADIVTLPVKAAGAGVDAVTTSQDEADRNRGREIRRQEERAARERARNRSEEHTSELQSLMRNSYAVFCLKKKNNKKTPKT